MSKKAKPLILSPDSMRYHKRTAPLSVDSEAGPIRKMIFISDKPGKYVGLGKEVIKERRARKR